MSHILVCMLIGALSLSPEATARARNGLSRQIGDATNIFSINVLKEVFNNDPGNVVVSPVGLSTLLTMMHQASASNTRKQLTQVLHAGPHALQEGYSKLILGIKKEENNGTLEFSNAVFLHQGRNVLDSFMRTMEKSFMAQVDYVNFGNPEKAAFAINAWVSEHTHGRIKQLISPASLSLDTLLVLTNAIYFKSLWQVPFLQEYTRKAPFRTLGGAQVMVPTMRTDGPFREGDIENLQSRWIELPYQGKQYSMLIVMPARNNSFQEMIHKFTAQHLTNIINTIKTAYKSDLALTLPKFKLTTQVNFVPILKQLGLTDIFGMRSDLPGITGGPLSIDQVVQKAEIEVDEKGTTASSASGIGAVAISAPTPFTVNRPFLFFIIDSINSIPLFGGKVTDPSK